jgi:hypothetical protein
MTDSLQVISARLSKHSVTSSDVAFCLAEQRSNGGAKPLVDALVQRSDIVALADHHEGLWPSQWAKLFAKHGYKPYDLLRYEMWWDQRVDWWLRQNLLIFATDEAAAARGWVECPESGLDLAQPALLLEELRPRIRATVCIPWRPSPSRLAAFERVQAYWTQFGWPVVTADSETEVFSLAQARNNAVAQAKTEVVVIADADTVIDPLNVLRAAAEPSGVCWPFTKYRTIDQEYLDLPYEQLVTVPYLNTWDGEGVAGVGGCLITTRKEYWRLGGQPPEFIGWGWEDTAFTMVVRTLSRAKRAVGYLYSFEHNTDPDGYLDAKADSPGWDRDVRRNEYLIEPYRRCDQRPWMMRSLLKSRRVEA